MARTFRQLLQSPDVAPTWLRQSVLGGFLGAVGLTLDLGTEWLFQGIAQRHPQQCDPSAFPYHARDRGVFFGIAATEEAKRRQLINWRQSARRAGSAWGILHAVQDYFAPDTPVVRLVSSSLSDAQWWTVDEDGEHDFQKIAPTNWDWDSDEPGQTDLDSHRRFWIIIYQHANANPRLFGPLPTEEAHNPPITRGTTGFVRGAKDLVKIIDYMKQAGTWHAGTIIAHNSALFDPSGSGAGYPDGTWYRYSDAATHLPVRPSAARFFHDRRRPGLYTENLTSEI